MEISICVKDKNGKKKDVNIDYVKFQKMLFLFNAIDDGWTIKKKEDSYIFKKNQ